MLTLPIAKLNKERNALGKKRGPTGPDPRPLMETLPRAPHSLLFLFRQHFFFKVNPNDAFVFHSSSFFLVIFFFLVVLNFLRGCMVKPQAHS